MNAAQILQGIQSDTRAEFLILGMLLLCIVMLIYVWVNKKKSTTIKTSATNKRT